MEKEIPRMINIINPCLVSGRREKSRLQPTGNSLVSKSHQRDKMSQHSSAGENSYESLPPDECFFGFDEYIKERD